MRTIEEIRKDIDRVDENLVSLLETRLGLSKEIACVKKTQGKPVFDPVREQERLEFAAGFLKDKAYTQEMKDLFNGIMSVSRSLQEKTIHVVEES